MKIILFSFFIVLSLSAQARGVYQSSQAFLTEVFNARVPKAAVIWFTGDVRDAASTILQHKPPRLRVRYWANTSRSAWILEEIGKEQPITVGIVIESGRIVSLKVLAFRESRGDEVRHDFFTQQFRRARLEKNLQLDKTIDGISGATLSVRALRKLARLALYLDSQRAQP